MTVSWLVANLDLCAGESLLLMQLKNWILMNTFSSAYARGTLFILIWPHCVCVWGGGGGCVRVCVCVWGGACVCACVCVGGGAPVCKLTYTCPHTHSFSSISQELYT